jgi:hypothetical protein
MWQLALLALASATPGGQDQVHFEGELFGPQHTLTCTWFTNFENSRFEQCHDATGKLLREDDGASIKCLRDICKQLDFEARKAAGGPKSEPPSGTFTVRLIGRLGLYPHEKRYLGDATRTVLIDKLVSVHVSR